uniref:FCP1 homology domain-containing protein n=1 Tax=Trypanosoma vivax (strain Y486) TaxID=1055687 RepID=G0TSN0_TRYVY|nr:conserved hypothetical protein [Trypanosoma vivax Y486]
MKGEMSQDAMSFFRGISAKIISVKQSYSKKVCKKWEEGAQPQQPVGVALQVPSPQSAPTASSSPSSVTHITAHEVCDGALPTARRSSLQRTSVFCASVSVSQKCVVNTNMNVPDTSGASAGTSSALCVENHQQVSGSLMTQVRRPLAQLPSKDSNTLPSVNCSHGPTEGESVDDSARDYKTAVVEDDNYDNAVMLQVQCIKNMPKNTSPVVARNHASLLPMQMPRHNGKVSLILDLDETLVHSSLTLQPRHYDLMLDVRVESATTRVYVAFRPFMQEFLQAVAPLFEVIIFTASVSAYCNDVMNAIDPDNILGSLRLFREHCSILNGAYVKDLSLLGRDLEKVVILDNSPVAYLFQPRNAIPITSWFDDSDDDELYRLIPVLRTLAEAESVYSTLDQYNAV